MYGFLFCEIEFSIIFMSFVDNVLHFEFRYFINHSMIILSVCSILTTASDGPPTATWIIYV